MIEQLHFVEPDLRAIDTATAEVIACSAFQDERPLRGLAGLLDWRLAGRLSVLAKNDFLTGAEGEIVLVPGRPYVRFEKILVLGIGPRATFDDGVVRRVLAKLVSALEGLKVRRALVEVPGRPSGKLEPGRAAELLLECAENALEDEMWTLVDDEAAEKSMAQKLVRRRDARSRPDA
ncbi:MAG TPA: M17 family peptidase N-terminal domain-containing protein [Polyangiaceae bacterium]